MSLGTTSGPHGKGRSTSNSRSSAPLLDARIVWAEDGGPIRTVITGRKRHPTARPSSAKNGFRSWPLESVHGEGNVFQLAEASTAVLEFVTQPCRLEMRLEGIARQLVYFPDMLMRVESDFAEDFLSGMRFEEAALAWRSGHGQGTTRILVEVKAKRDMRKDDHEYLAKLALAKSVFESEGIHFVVMEEDIDFSANLPEAVQDIFFERDTQVLPGDIATVVSILSSSDTLGSYGFLKEALGGHHAASAKLHALHVRRVISIDLSQPLHDASKVRLVRRSN